MAAARLKATSGTVTVRIAENGFATSRSVNKSAKVVLGRALITPRGDSPRGQVDVAHHPDYHCCNESCTGEHSRYYGRAKQNHS
jgi:hypothetical protein